MSATTIVVNDVEPRRQYTATTAQTLFDFPIPFFDTDDLTVWLTPNGQAADDAADLLAITTDYTVSGENTQDGGLVTLVVAATAGDIITIERIVDIERLADYQNSGDLLAETLNKEQDTEIFISQQLRQDVQRSLQLPKSGTITDGTLPAAEALKFIRVNLAGTGFEYTEGTTSAVASDVVNAPAGGITSINVQDAINELDTEKQNITYTPSGTGAVARTVESKIGELVSVKDFGAVGDGVTDDTAAIQAALDSFSSPLGGKVFVNPEGRYVVSSLTIPNNVTLTGAYEPDQDEGNVYGYDSFYGCLFVAGSINVAGHGAGIEGIAVLASHLNGYSTPTTDGEANTLVAAFAGTAIILSGTGTHCRNLMALGFNAAIVDTGNRHRISRVRFDCVSGISIGGGSDVSRIDDCHGWPYLTAELSLSASVNYRSGNAFEFSGNCDKFSMRDLYCFGYEQGYKFLGSAGNIVQSCSTFNIVADSGNIGASGTSVGISVGSYTADLDVYEPSVQNYDINIQVNTQGADTGGGDRLDKIKFHGGKCLEASSKFIDVVNGYVGMSGMSLQKGSTATVIIDWDATDGGYITNCDFEEMAASSGVPLVDFVNSTAERAVQRVGNYQEATIHADNLFIDNQVDMTREIIATSGEVTIATGVITVIGSRHIVDTEADAASDDLDTINGGIDGMKLWLRAVSSSRTIVCKDGTGNLALAGDFSLTSATDCIELAYESSIGGGTWVEQSRSDNGV